MKITPAIAAEIIRRQGPNFGDYGIRVNTKMDVVYIRRLNKFEKDPELAKKQLEPYLLTKEWMQANCAGKVGWKLYKGKLIPAVAACVADLRKKKK